MTRCMNTEPARMGVSCQKAAPNTHLSVFNNITAPRHELTRLPESGHAGHGFRRKTGYKGGATAEENADAVRRLPARRINAAFARTDCARPEINLLTDALNISERTLQRCMRDHFGITASEWLHHKQMQHALYLLQNGGKSIGETAYFMWLPPLSLYQAFRQYFWAARLMETKRKSDKPHFDLKPEIRMSGYVQFWVLIPASI